MRRPPLRSKGSARGSFPDAATNQEYVTESSVEERLLLGLLADPRVERLRDQWPKVSFRDAEGETRTHVFDFTAFYADGTSFAFAVRPRKSGTLAQLSDDVDRINAQGSLRGLAGRARVVTDLMVPFWSAWNAAKVIEYAEVMHGPDVVEAARHALGLGHGAVFGDLMRGAPVEAWRRAAVWWLVREGAVVPRTRDRLKDWLPVRLDRERLNKIIEEMQ